MLQSKVALITGSATNIGRAVAVRMAAEGAHVVIHAKSNEEGAKKVVTDITRSGGNAIFVTGDLSNPPVVQGIFETILAKFGTLDILVNNAGAAKGTPFAESNKENWISAFDDNFFSAVLCSIEATKIMRKAGQGKIINTASIRGLDHLGRPGIMAYSAAKAALINFTKTLAKEVAPNILVNAVAPGFVYTSNYDAVPQETKDKFLDGTSIKRWITSDEVAEAYLFLANSDVMTGEVIVVDGGFTLKEN